MTYRHQVFGLTITSELECPELLAAAPDARPDIQVRLANLTPDPDSARGDADPVQSAPGVYQFRIAGVACYRVEAGERILIDPVPGAAEVDVRLWLLGTALGALLHQRGLLPLHVSALALDGAAFAFCGESGAGKSTLAAALHRRGLPLLTDDVGLAVPEGDRVLFYPGFPRIKLWRDALDHFGLDHRPLIRDLTRLDKYHLRLVDDFQDRPLPLRHLYRLERAADDAIRIEPLSGHRAIGLIRDNTYRPEVMRRLGQAGEHLRQCGRIARRVRVFRFNRPWRLEGLDASLDELMDHISYGRELLLPRLPT
jgi:hypothetical protein